MVVTTPRTDDYQDFVFIQRVKFDELFKLFGIFPLCIILDKILELHGFRPSKSNHRKYALEEVNLTEQ